MRASAAWRRLSWADRTLLAEAMLLLGFASLWIAVMPFRRVASLATRGHPAPSPATAALVRRIRWAVDACARRSPWRAVCFQQGLAAHMMLRRRGFESALFYGARRDETGELAAHVWVRSGGEDVIGCETASSYGLLAVFGANRQGDL